MRRADAEIASRLGWAAPAAQQADQEPDRKNDHGAEVFSPAREEEVLKNVLDTSKGPLDTGTVRAIFREIMSGSRALQKVVKVAYLGPEYSFSHLAAIPELLWN